MNVEEQVDQIIKRSDTLYRELRDRFNKSTPKQRAKIMNCSGPDMYLLDEIPNELRRRALCQALIEMLITK